jgi:hypothetical protein
MLFESFGHPRRTSTDSGEKHKVDSRSSLMLVPSPDGKTVAQQLLHLGMYAEMITGHPSAIDCEVIWKSSLQQPSSL